MTAPAEPLVQSILQTTAADPVARVDPYPRLAALQRQCPVFRDEAQKTTFLSRYSDVKAIANDRTLLRHPSNAEHGAMARRVLNDDGGTQDVRPGGHSILFLDDPDHARIRQPLAKALYARVAAMKTRIEAVIDAAFDRLGTPARFDLMADLAIPIPVLTIARILGVEEDRLGEFRDWSEAIILDLSPVRTPEEDQRMAEGRDAARDYFFELMAARRISPREDLISDIVALQAQGAPLADGEVVTNLIALLVGGNLTTSDLIGTGVRLLLTHPDQRAALRADPALANAAVEEVLRYDSPVDFTGRIASRDLTVGGCPIAKSTSMVVSLRAANRDPAMFDQPDSFDITRKHVPHVAFGGGAHICIGAPLARIEAAAAFLQILRRFPNLRLTDRPPVWRGLPVFRGLQELWVET